MVMARPKREHQRDTRAEILSAALDLFSEKGFFGTSLRDIAKVVSIQQSALYHYFESKEQILHGLIAELGPGRAGQLFSLDAVSMAKSMGTEAMFQELVSSILFVWSTPQEQKLFRIFLQEGYRLRREGIISVATTAALVKEQIERLFTSLMEAGLVRKGDTGAYAFQFMSLLMLTRMMFLAVPTETPDMKTLLASTQRHLTFFLKAIAPESAEPRGRAARRK